MAHVKRRAGRGAGTFLVVLLVAVVLGAIGGMLWGRMSRPVASPVGTKPSKPAPAKPAKPVKPIKQGSEQLVLSEGQLTEMLRQAAGEAASDAKVTLEPGLIVVTGKLKRGSLGVPLRMSVEPYVENGSISVRVKEAKAGGLSLPDAAGSLAVRIKAALYEQQQKIKGLVVDTVEIKDKELVLTGHFEDKTEAR